MLNVTIFHDTDTRRSGVVRKHVLLFKNNAELLFFITLNLDILLSYKLAVYRSSFRIVQLSSTSPNIKGQSRLLLVSYSQCLYKKNDCH